MAAATETRAAVDKVAHHPALPVLSYCLASILMTVINKFVVSGAHFTMNCLLLAIQSIVGVLCVILSRKLGLLSFRDWDSSDARRWFPVSCLLVANIYTGSKSLQYLSIPVYTIFKNLTIILIAYGEVVWFGGRVSPLTLISFGLMVLSSVIAAWSDISHALQAFQAAHGGFPSSLSSLYRPGVAGAGSDLAAQGWHSAHLAHGDRSSTVTAAVGAAVTEMAKDIWRRSATAGGSLFSDDATELSGAQAAAQMGLEGVGASGTVEAVHRLGNLNAGYIWMLANCLMSAAYVLAMRKRIKSIGFKDWDTMFYNNLLSIPVLAVMSMLVEDWTVESLHRNFPAETRNFLLFAIVVSGAAAVFISYTTAWCLRATSSTTFSMVGALNKLPVAASGLLFFGDPVTLGSVSAIAVGFVAGLVYAWAKNLQAKTQSYLPASSSPSNNNNFPRSISPGDSVAAAGVAVGSGAKGEILPIHKVGAREA